ncbi:MAG: hypothetical protein ACRED5_06045 [Propylenella sp.]
MRKGLFCGVLVAAIIRGAVPLAVAAEAEQQAVRNHCQTELNVPPGACDCLAGKAAEMSEGQQQLLAAILSGDDARAASLRATLPVAEQMQAGLFHVHQTPACAGG